MTAQAKLDAKIAAQTTERLKEISIRLNLVSTVDATIVIAAAEKELEARMPEADFLAFMEELDTMLDAAA